MSTTTTLTPTASTTTRTHGTHAPVRPGAPAGRRPQRTVGTPRRAPQRVEVTVGQRVALSCTDGEYRGRVVEGPAGTIRLRAGAGWWDVPRSSILGVTVLAELPIPPVDEVAQRRRAAEQADRILSRWP